MPTAMDLPLDALRGDADAVPATIGGFGGELTRMAADCDGWAERDREEAQ
jgi:hypothetical protein